MKKPNVFLISILLLVPLIASNKTFAIDNTTIAIDSFKAAMKTYFKSYTTNNHLALTKLGGGWVTEFFEPKMDYKYDIQKTDSVITPYTAYCDFVMVRSFTNFYSMKEVAKDDRNFTQSDECHHIHYYVYQNGEWFVIKRTHFSRDQKEEYDCNEVISEGENARNKDIFGCWELSMKYVGAPFK